jgi:hypothetical protein
LKASHSLKAYESRQVLFGGGAPGRVEFRSRLNPSEEMATWLRAAQLPPAPVDSEESDNTAVPMPDDLPPLDPSEPEGLDIEVPQTEDDTPQLEQDETVPPTEEGPIEGTPIQPAPLDTTMPPGPLPERIPTPTVDTMEAEREKSDEACEQGLEDLQQKTISTLSLDIAVAGTEGSDFPFECTLEDSGWHTGRCWEETTYMWKASALCHKPLFFEDEQLERYGHSWSPCCQPLVSACHFFTRLPILPYCMGVEPPNECIYALGHYRPGSCAPYMCNPVPLSFRGAMFQAGASVGTAAVLP